MVYTEYGSPGLHYSHQLVDHITKLKSQNGHGVLGSADRNSTHFRQSRALRNTVVSRRACLPFF